MINYADWLVNSLEWAARRGVDIFSCDYLIHILGRYQVELLNGSWSRDGRKLSPSTTNNRVGIFCEFLQWMFEMGFRTEFIIPLKKVKLFWKSGRNSHGDKPIEYRVRVGRVRIRTKALRMPDDNSLRRWLKAVYKKWGYTIGLICESILRVALRREEVLSLPLYALPANPAEWDIVNPTLAEAAKQIRLTLSHGTKGEWHGDTKHGTKIGPAREILVPLELAQKWHDYRRNQRNAAFAKWMKLAPKGAAQRKAHAERAGCLFLDDRTGMRLLGTTLYYRWKSVRPPVPGWSVHDGRTWWACAKLWRMVKTRLSIRDLRAETDLAILYSTGKSIIELEISPQLGHVEPSTTNQYLRWLRDMLSTPVDITETALESEAHVH